MLWDWDGTLARIHHALYVATREQAGREASPTAARLAQVLFSKYGLHLPLNRQSAAYAREGIDLDVSTLADWEGAAAATLMPLIEMIHGHVFAAERIHADDTTVPVLAKGKTRTGRLWTYVRDDRPFGGHDPPGAIISTRVIELASIRSFTWRATPPRCRRTPKRASTGSMERAARWG
jgi:hypothetical protein